MGEPNKTAATEPETRPEAAKLQDAPRRRVGSLTLGACLIAAGIFFLCYYFVPGFDWQLVVRIAPAAALVLLGCEVLFFAARPGRWKYDFVSVLVCLGLIKRQPRRPAWRPCWYWTPSPDRTPSARRGSSARPRMPPASS